MCLHPLKHTNADDRVQTVPSPDGVTISPLDKSSRPVSLVVASALGSDRYTSGLSVVRDLLLSHLLINLRVSFEIEQRLESKWSINPARDTKFRLGIQRKEDTLAAK